jgi:GGDEF domain-containing protein
MLSLSFFWTEAGFLLAFLATHAVWPVAAFCLNVPLALFRLRLHRRSAQAIRADPQGFSNRVIAASIAWCTLLAAEILGLLLVADVRTTVLAAILHVGFRGYAAAQFAASARMALLLFVAAGGGGFSAGLACSPFHALHVPALLVPLVLVAFAVILYSIHGIPLTAFRSQPQYRLLSLHDPLTQLANRKLMRERLAEPCATSAGSARHGGFAVFCIDLGGFRKINDRLGMPQATSS